MKGYVPPNTRLKSAKHGLKCYWGQTSSENHKEHHAPNYRKVKFMRAELIPHDFSRIQPQKIHPMRKKSIRKSQKVQMTRQGLRMRGSDQIEEVGQKSGRREEKGYGAAKEYRGFEERVEKYGESRASCLHMKKQQQMPKIRPNSSQPKAYQSQQPKHLLEYTSTGQIVETQQAKKRNQQLEYELVDQTKLEQSIYPHKQTQKSGPQLQALGGE